MKPQEHKTLRFFIYLFNYVKDINFSLFNSTTTGADITCCNRFVPSFLYHYIDSMIATTIIITCKKLRFTMYSPSIISFKLCITTVANTNSTIHRIMMHDCGLRYPIMYMLWLGCVASVISSNGRIGVASVVCVILIL